MRSIGVGEVPAHEDAGREEQVPLELIDRQLLPDLQSHQLLGLHVGRPQSAPEGHEGLPGAAQHLAVVVEHLVLGPWAAEVGPAAEEDRGLAEAGLDAGDAVAVLVQDVAALVEAAVVLAAEEADGALGAAEVLDPADQVAVLEELEELLGADLAEAAHAGALPAEGALDLPVEVDVAHLLTDALVVLDLRVGLLQLLLLERLVAVEKHVDPQEHPHALVPVLLLAALHYYQRSYTLITSSVGCLIQMSVSQVPVWTNSLACSGEFVDANKMVRNVAGAAAFTMFLFFLLSQIFYAIKYLPGASSSDPSSEPGDGSASSAPSLGWDNTRWREWFLVNFGVHVVALSTAVTFHPVAAAVLAWLHLLFFLVCMVINFVKRDDRESTGLRYVNLGTGVLMAIMNVSLVIAGAAGIRLYNCA